MSEQPSLWAYALQESPEETPFEFMKEQGKLLHEQTRGILWGEVVPFFQHKIAYHEFRIASSRLDNYRCVLLRTAHTSFIYPLYVYDYTDSKDDVYEKDRLDEEASMMQRDIELFKEIQKRKRDYQSAREANAELEKNGGIFAPPIPDYEAANFPEFETIFATILQSKGTRSIIQSLLLQGKPTPVPHGKTG